MEKTSKKIDIDRMGKLLEQFKTHCQGIGHPNIRNIKYDIMNYITTRACPDCCAVFPRQMNNLEHIIQTLN